MVSITPKIRLSRADCEDILRGELLPVLCEQVEVLTNRLRIASDRNEILRLQGAIEAYNNVLGLKSQAQYELENQ